MTSDKRFVEDGWMNRSEAEAKWEQWAERDRYRRALEEIQALMSECPVEHLSTFGYESWQIARKALEASDE